MAALVSVHNDGPDAVEIRLGRRSILLVAGGDFRVATSQAVELSLLPPVSREDMALHMGTRPATDEPMRVVTD